MTRAKKHLVIFCNSKTVGKESSIEKLVQDPVNYNEWCVRLDRALGIKPKKNWTKKKKDANNNNVLKPNKKCQNNKTAKLSNTMQLLTI